MEYRVDMYHGIIREQFQLAYFGRVDYGSTEDMAIGERKVLYDLLLDQKQEERKQQEQALQESRSNSGWKKSR